MSLYNLYRTKGNFVPTFDNVIVNFSFGTGSFCAAKKMVEEFGKDKVSLVFADTKAEDEDTYKWGKAAVEHLGCRLITYQDGRSPWQLFEDNEYIGNTRVDLCSRVLKRELIDSKLKTYNKYRTLLVFGIHWSEKDRFERQDKTTGGWSGIYWRLRKKGWRYIRAPLCEPPFISIEDMENMVKDSGLWKQKLYEDGFPHANCAGECVKQGQAGWKLLYKKRREQFNNRRDWEQEMRRRTGKNISILAETKNGKKIPLTLVELERRIEEGKECDEGGMGGCSCFAGDE